MEDYQNLRLSIAATKVVEKIYETNFFKDRLDICKFAMAYAIREFYEQFDPLEVDKSEDAQGLNYNIGSVDKEKEVSTLVKSLYPAQPPFKVARGLMIFGLEKLNSLLEQDKLFPLNQVM